MIEEALLIDDDQATNFIHSRLIKKSNLVNEIHTVSDGLEALTFLREFTAKNNRLPKVIFLDINMPKMNGWEFLEEFEKGELNKHKTESNVVIMLTTSLNPDDRDKALAFDSIAAYCAKPLNIEFLEELFAKSNK